MQKILALVFFSLVLLGACEKDPSGGYTPGQTRPVPGGDGGGIAPPPSEPEYFLLTAANHPRIYMDDAEFASMKAKIESGSNPVLAALHEVTMQSAKGKGLSNTVLVKTLDKSNKRMLGISQEAFMRIFTCAYAYRYTGDKKYLEHAENDLIAVCDFENWNSKLHFLDTAEMTAAVALGYDWLYNDLSENTRRLVESKIKEYAFDQVDKKNWSMNFYANTGNWNQVCNGGLVLGALAIYETLPEKCRQMIEASAESVVKAMEVNYAPDGNYPEGPGYWTYGTIYQVAMLTALETTLGTDFSLSKAQGFDKTGKYILYTAGAINKVFNYADNVESESANLPLWYFADKFAQEELLIYEQRFLEDGKYPVGNVAARFMPLVMTYAARVNLSGISAPTEQMYVGRGAIPVVMVHTDWTRSESDKFLGIKGGHAGANHGHMDAGSFVFDAEGVRWSMDMPRQTYSDLEVGLKALGGGGLFSAKQDAMRWDITRLNNFHHSTLTVNGAYHRVDGVASISKLVDTDRAKGAVLDLSPVFAGEARSVSRSVSLQKNGDLYVQDELSALSNKDAKLRWTMISTAVPTVSGNHIQLLAGDKVRYLSVVSDGPAVTLKTWSTSPSAFGKAINSYEKELKGVYALGFETTVPKGESAVFKVILSTTK